MLNQLEKFLAISLALISLALIVEIQTRNPRSVPNFTPEQISITYTQCQNESNVYDLYVAEVCNCTVTRAASQLSVKKLMDLDTIELERLSLLADECREYVKATQLESTPRWSR